MTKIAQPLGTRLRAVSIALAFAIVLPSALAAAPWGQAQTYKVLYNFTGASDGSGPGYGSLAQDEAGNLYGTTEFGGDLACFAPAGCGTVFKVTESGTETVLYSFTGGADGEFPFVGVVLSGNKLYGTTFNGGSGYGVVFEVNIKTGAETVLYAFTGGSDGANPGAGLVLDKEGDLYGTASGGGAYSDGTVFKVVPKAKKETVLHSFDGSDGEAPYSGLTLDTTEKVLYGTTFLGGSSDAGVVFSLTIETGTYTVLYNFTGSSDGGYPGATLLLDPEGRLYGTTVFGGASSSGTVFDVVPKTKEETVLYSFTGGADGSLPWGGVIRDKEGNLYGTAEYGGDLSCGAPYGCGTVFKVVPETKTETVLHTFEGSDGESPYCTLLRNWKGKFYGTTVVGGSGLFGVVFELIP